VIDPLIKNYISKFRSVKQQPKNKEKIRISNEKKREKLTRTYSLGKYISLAINKYFLQGRCINKNLQNKNSYKKGIQKLF